MKYDVTFSCGHTQEVQIYGKAEERERKIKYFGKSGLCPECYKKKMNREKAENCEEVRMSYRKPSLSTFLNRKKRKKIQEKFSGKL